MLRPENGENRPVKYSLVLDLWNPLIDKWPDSFIMVEHTFRCLSIDSYHKNTNNVFHLEQGNDIFK